MERPKTRLSRADLEVCLGELLPDRGRTALDCGHYLLNWRACANCGRMTEIVEAGRETDARAADEVDEGSDDGECDETTTFMHRCATCSVVICEHYYNFRFDDERACQVYTMSCLLCGKGGSESFIDFDDGSSGAASGGAAEAGASATKSASSGATTIIALPRQVVSDFEVVDALRGALQSGMVDAADAMRAKLLEAQVEGAAYAEEGDEEGAAESGCFDGESSAGEEEELADAILFG